MVIERAPGEAEDESHRVLLTDRKANNNARAERVLVSMTWQDGVPTEAIERPYALELADQIEDVLNEGR